MTLWNKPITQITFEDIEAFCQAGWEENNRLDYKGDSPNDLEKTISAMANTIGGLIVLGVDADKATNKPVWPPVPPTPPKTGLAMAPNISERVYQLCNDSIFPPIMPEVSQVIANKRMPGYALLVIRIPESKDAPHAVDKKKHVYVFERTGNQNHPHKPADIEYIERLIKRRERHEIQREEIIAKAVARAKSQIKIPNTPFRWASVIPHYPWRAITTPEKCHAFHRGWNSTEIAPYCAHRYWQQIPGGSLCIYYDKRNNEFTPVACSSITDRGHVLAVSLCVEALDRTEDRKFDYDFTERMFSGLLGGARSFYQVIGPDSPFFLMASLGILDVRDWRMWKERRDRSNYVPSLFPDDSFRTDGTLLGMEKGLHEVGSSMMKDFGFAFDAQV